MMLVAIAACSWAVMATILAVIERQFRVRWRALAIEAIAQCERGTEALTGDAKPDPIDACQVPPEGWTCSRGAGHEGPCAARRAT
ncbi:MAG: hypothetical protein JWM74_4164 [Myxococcaceae bacterium]|nr:hypothetical protein [Myxococcaceae bacterium]